MVEPTDLTHPLPMRQGSTYRRPGQLTLRVVSGPCSGREVVVSKDRIVVGRSRTADLTLEHSSVSGAHFELRIGGEGIEVRDLDSTNGIRIGTIEVLHAVVAPGVIISAGECGVQIMKVNDVDIDIQEEEDLCDMVGASPAMREVFAQIRKISKTPLDVLVTVETGTGKGLACRAIYATSRIYRRSLVTLDCGTLARSLAESAIFGVKKGAFTGADSDSPGYVEHANGGTLFIDEIGELPLDLQVKLLRVLDQREVIRLGETRPISVDLRVIAATNRDLERMVADGTFREDLYYRLSCARLELPPLRRRGLDIVRIADRVVSTVSNQRGIDLEINAEAKEALVNYSWPGNVRELADVVRLAAYTADGCMIGVSDLVLGAPLKSQGLEQLYDLPYKRAHRELDKTYLARALKAAKGSAAACSRNIGISRTTLRRRCEELSIRYIND